MPLGDLRQRYMQTFINYGDDLIYIDEVRANDNEDAIVLRARVVDKKTYALGIRRDMPFEWEKVNTIRPDARWYLVPNPEKFGGSHTATYMGYPCARQFYRGLSARNVVTHPTRYAPPVSNSTVVSEAFHQQHSKTYEKLTQDIIDLGPKLLEEWGNKGVCTERSVLLSPQMLASSWAYMGKSATDVYYRGARIGWISDEEKKCFMFRPQFIEEMKELSMPALWERYNIVDAPPPKITQKPQRLFDWEHQPMPRNPVRIEMGDFQHADLEAEQQDVNFAHLELGEQMRRAKIAANIRPGENLNFIIVQDATYCLHKKLPSQAEIALVGQDRCHEYHRAAMREWNGFPAADQRTMKMQHYVTQRQYYLIASMAKELARNAAQRVAQENGA